MKRVTAIKCNNCLAIFQKTKNGVSFKGDCCPFCGIVSKVIGGIESLQTVRINENKLTTKE